MKKRNKIHIWVFWTIIISYVISIILIITIIKRSDNRSTVSTLTQIANDSADKAAMIAGNLESIKKEYYSEVIEDEVPISSKLDRREVSSRFLLDYEPVKYDEIPDYSGEPYCIINDDIPFFSAYELKTEIWEYYSPLDTLGRCGVATSVLAKELMPTEERGSIAGIRPSGWHTVKYPDIITDRYLYNRCHLIAYCLSGENDNERNLITGTRYMNVTGMLPFENTVCDYINATGNHVLYRVTPIFLGDELVARGVQMEAYSVEDDGDGICFNVFVYNIQPDIEIDYLDGESRINRSD